MNEALNRIGYELRGFIRLDEGSYVVMAEQQHRVGVEQNRYRFATLIRTTIDEAEMWDFGTGDLTFEQARDDMADRAGYVRGEQAMIDGIRVQQMRVDDAARVRPGRRG